MRNAVATFFLLSATWLVWSGHYKPLLLGFGAASCLLVLFVSSRMGLLDDEVNPLLFGLRPFRYLPWLLFEVAKSNVTVAKIILDPKLPIRPKLIFVRPSQHTAFGQVTYANSITLTPGTVTLDIRGGRILVHALTEGTAYDLVQGEMDRRVRQMEGET